MDILARAALLRREGRAFVLATVTWARGPSSGKAGSKAVIHPDGRVEGWLGGACAAPTVVRSSLQALGDGRARVLSLGRSDDRSGVTEVPMACDSEGEMEVFVEPMAPAPHLVIAGSSPMTAALAETARAVGWRTSQVAEAAHAESIVEMADRSYVVAATQGSFDEPALLAALGTSAVYVGLVASPKRAEAVRDWLRDNGVSEEDALRVRAPAGMDLGSTTHEEMAVSIMAELVAHRSSHKDLAAPPVELPEQATDPICGMSVDPATAAFTAEHDGRRHYFCAAGCQKAFRENPAPYLSA